MPEESKDPPAKGDWIKARMDGGGELDVYVGESEELPELEEMIRQP